MSKFQSQSIFAASLILAALMPGCAIGMSNQDSLADRVTKLVDDTTKSEKRQDNALKELQALGNQAVPDIVGHLNDIRPLAKGKISLANKASNAFEGLRHYSPDTVHDALSAVLNQLTGESFVFVYNGATPQEREDNRRKWIEWCRIEFPTQTATCSGE